MRKKPLDASIVRQAIEYRDQLRRSLARGREMLAQGESLLKADDPVMMVAQRKQRAVGQMLVLIDEFLALDDSVSPAHRRHLFRAILAADDHHRAVITAARRIAKAEGLD